MRKTIFLVLLTLVLTVALSAQDVAVATVRLEKTEPISGQLLDSTVAALEEQEGRPLSTAEKKQVLDEMINQVLIIQAAEADRAISVTDAEVEQAGLELISQQLQAIGVIPPGAVLTDKREYRQVIEQQGVTVAEFEQTVRNQLLAEKYITTSEQEVFQGIGSASPDEISNEYQERLREFTVADSVWFNHIFFDTHQSSPEEAREKGARAREVHRQLMNSPANFAEFVASESEDEVSKATGGLVGPVLKTHPAVVQLYGKEFLNAVFALNVNEVSGVLKSNVGYHIVQITQKAAARLLPQNDPEVKAYLEQVIFAQKFQRSFEEVARKLTKELRERATIQYFGEYQ